MSKKTVQFKMPNGVAAKPVTPDDWVGSRLGQEPADVVQLVQPAEPMKRFTIDVGEGLHRRIKAACANRGTKMADVIREMLEREFPKADAR
jgi:hypothetical protein